MNFKKNSHVIATCAELCRSSLFGCAAISSLLFLAACGDDSSSNSSDNEVADEDYTFTLEELEEMGVPIFESADKLGDCGSENEFETVYVKADSSFYMCSEGKWTNDFSDAIQTVESVDDLEQCTDELEGEMVRVKATNVDGDTVHLYYTCEGGKWESDIGGAGETFGTFTDKRDGKTYRTVQIGSQTWMAENLNYNYNEGTAKSYCYDNNPDNCTKYGRLYMWSAAMDSAGAFSAKGKKCGDGTECKPSGTIRGVCPEGWHLPNKNEWIKLQNAIDDRQ